MYHCNMILNSINKYISDVKRCVNPFYIGSATIDRLRKEVDRRIIVCPEHEFVYIRIPKCANSTISMLLYQATTGHVDDNMRPRYAKQFFNHPGEVGLLNSIKARYSYFIFTFVRNPYDRLLSVYLNKFVLANRSRQSYLGKLYGDTILKYCEGQESTFLGFCRYLDHGGVRVDPHWLPMVDFMWPSVKRIDYIGRLETIETDMKNIFKRIYGKFDFNIQTRYGPEPTNAEKKISRYYDEECKEIIRRLYRADFDCFEYNADI